MTICMGALCQDDDGGVAVVLAADRMVTWMNLTEFEHRVPKMHLVSPTAFAMIAGNTLAGTQIAERTRAQVAGLPHPVSEVADMAAQQYSQTRLEAAEAAVLRPRGLGFQQYYQMQQQLLPQITGGIDQQLAAFDLGVELIVAGVDGTGAHLFSIHNPGGPTQCHDVIGSVAIGSGQIHAVQSMIGFRHAAMQPLKDTIFRVFVSKRRAELAPGVGRDTDILVLTARGAFQLTVEQLDQLNVLHDALSAELVTSTQGKIDSWNLEVQAPAADTLVVAADEGDA